jgi:nucleotide-binding universal stress UspA family protein
MEHLLYKKILVPLDGSTLAECALDHAKAIAAGCNIPEVILFRVVEPNPAVSEALSEGAVMYAELNDQMQQLAEKYLTAITLKFRQESGVDVHSAVAYGYAANEILEYAAKNNVDLIIMTSHGRSGISRWLFGSVAERVSQHSTVPVLIVTPTGCRGEVPVESKK